MSRGTKERRSASERPPVTRPNSSANGRMSDRATLGNTAPCLTLDRAPAASFASSSAARMSAPRASAVPLAAWSRSAARSNSACAARVRSAAPASCRSRSTERVSRRAPGEPCGVMPANASSTAPLFSARRSANIPELGPLARLLSNAASPGSCVRSASVVAIAGNRIGDTAPALDRIDDRLNVRHFTRRRLGAVENFRKFDRRRLRARPEPQDSACRKTARATSATRGQERRVPHPRRPHPRPPHQGPQRYALFRPPARRPWCVTSFARDAPAPAPSAEPASRFANCSGAIAAGFDERAG